MRVFILKHSNQQSLNLVTLSASKVETVHIQISQTFKMLRYEGVNYETTQ